MNILNNNGYFAAANSQAGFVSFFDKIFSPSELNFLYIIKGGSGTGKSRLMKQIGEAAAAAGDTPEYFYCSSDPSSLDGILLKDRKVAVIDGTAPHVAEPRLPGCFDEIINLSIFWNGDVLKEHKNDISNLCAEKNRLYHRAYTYLAAAGNLNRAADLLCMPAVKQEKLDNWARRFASRFVSDGRGEEKTRLTSAISYMGVVDTGIFYDKAEKHYVIKDSVYLASNVLAALRNALNQRGFSCEVSFDPLDTSKVNAIYITDSNTSVTTADDRSAIDPDDSVINTERFFDRSIYRLLRTQTRFLHKCSETLTEYAVETMKEIFALHSEVEKVYISAMDFKAKERYTDKLIKKILY